jgi:3-oxoadipate enol-lactonase
VRRPGVPVDARYLSTIAAKAQCLNREILACVSDRVPDATAGTAEVNGVRLWYRITGEGEPVAQIHGAGFGHFNFDLATPALARHFRVVDYDMRGYGQSDRPVQRYDMEVWADDLVGLLDALDIERTHVHGTSMGGMIAIVFAGKYPERTTSVVINCAAAKLGHAGRLIFRNWIDIARLDPAGPGSRTLAELIAWQAFSKEFLEAPGAEEAIDNTQRILRESNDFEVFTAACQAMCDMDIRDWLPRISAPALVLGGSDDVMTPWDQGPGGAGQEAIYQGIAGAEKRVVAGSGHSTIFDNSEEHNRVVIEFFKRNALASRPEERERETRAVP